MNQNSHSNWINKWGLANSTAKDTNHTRKSLSAVGSEPVRTGRS